MPMIFT